MRAEFYERYRELFDAYTVEGVTRMRGGILPLQYDPNSERRVLSVRDAVERGIGRAQAGRQLRPDARYFLLVNFHEIVARPLARASEEPRDAATDPELVELIAEDVQTILQAAREEFAIPADRTTGEIGGGQVVRALGRVYDRLRTVGLDVWG